MHDGVATITFNRPAVLNALNTNTLKEHRQAFKKADCVAKVKSPVLTASGEEAFMVTELGNGICRYLEKLPKPSVAAVSKWYRFRWQPGDSYEL